MFADVIFLIAVGMLLLAAVQLFTRTGSGIDQHPYRHVWGGAPGADRPSRMSGAADRDVTSWSRGTR
jgi:hypothetical protein